MPVCKTVLFFCLSISDAKTSRPYAAWHYCLLWNSDLPASENPNGIFGAVFHTVHTESGKKFPRDDPIPFSSSSCILDQAVLSDTDGVPGACGDSDDIFPLLHLTLAVGIVSAGCHCTVSSYSCRVSIPAGDADDILPGSGFALSVPVAADCQYGAVLLQPAT